MKFIKIILFVFFTLIISSCNDNIYKYPLDKNEVASLLSDSSLDWYAEDIQNHQTSIGKSEQSIVTHSQNYILPLKNTAGQMCVLTMNAIPHNNSSADNDSNEIIDKSLSMSFWHESKSMPLNQRTYFHAKEEPLFWNLAGEMLGAKKELKSSKKKYYEATAKLDNASPSEFIWYCRENDFHCKIWSKWDDKEKIYLIQQIQLMQPKHFYENQISFAQYLIRNNMWSDSVLKTDDIKSLGSNQNTEFF